MGGRMMYPKVNAVIALLVSSNTGFDMSDLSRCIGGHCKKNLELSRYMGVDEAFMLVSGIEDPILADMVCFPCAVGSYEATVPQAVKMLEYLRDYGIVDWKKALEESNAPG
jgi:hypothetical protein